LYEYQENGGEVDLRSLIEKKCTGDKEGFEEKVLFKKFT
jgi:hypothetical protein